MTALPAQPEPAVAFARDTDLPVIEELEAELADLRAELAAIDAGDEPEPVDVRDRPQPEGASPGTSSGAAATQPDGGIG